MSELHTIGLVAREIQVYRPSEWGKVIADKLHVKGTSMVSLSPGLNLTEPVHCGGAPVIVKIYDLSTLSGAPTCFKTFYKADRTQIKWNDLGTQVLVLMRIQSNDRFRAEKINVLITGAVIPLRGSLSSLGDIST
ncbi:hypothetical protein F4604DRAFT_1919117 [Suillus subluteus]|nr:hypothetical protein F4604DRAFT_1919117 [Suillus subluteus]